MSVVTANPPLAGARASRSGRRWIRWGLSLGVLAGLGWGAKTAFETWFVAAPARPARGAVASVEAGAARRGEFPVVLTGLGTVTPVATSVVKSQISGQLVKVQFKEGQIIKAGDVLAQVDARPYRLALASAEGQLKKDEAILENAYRDLKRYETLRSQIKDGVSEQQLDTQRSLIGQTEGVVAMDRAQVDQARLNLDYTNIVSLIDGRVGLRTRDPGNYVQANDANGVAVVTQLSPITVIFTLPASELPAVLKRFRAGESLSVSVYDNDRAKPFAQGSLIAIDNQIDTTTGTVKLRALFPNDDERLYPNQFVNADVLVEKLGDVLLAPSASIQRGAKGAFAYVVGSDNVVAARQIDVGPNNGTNFVVESGLRDGERVVTLGADRLREGASVSLPDVTRPDVPEPRKAEGDGAPREGKKDRKS